jgi:hypothetical protein
MMQRLSTLRAQLETAKASEDFKSIASMGKALKALQIESSQLPLSEEDYLSLPSAHAALVQQVTNTCKALAQAREFSALGILCSKLKALKAMDLTGMQSAGNVEAVNDEDESAYDPVLPTCP